MAHLLRSLEDVGYIAFPSNDKLEDETSHLVGKSRAEHRI